MNIITLNVDIFDHITRIDKWLGFGVNKYFTDRANKSEKVEKVINEILYNALNYTIDYGFFSLKEFHNYLLRANPNPRNYRYGRSGMSTRKLWKGVYDLLDVKGYEYNGVKCIRSNTNTELQPYSTLKLTTTFREQYQYQRWVPIGKRKENSSRVYSLHLSYSLEQLYDRYIKLYDE